MSTVTVSFVPKDDKGSNPGDYEMFVDVSGASEIDLLPPAYYKVKGVKLYQGTFVDGTHFTPNGAKQDDIKLLKQGHYNDEKGVFKDVVLPTGFTFHEASSDDSTPARITDTANEGSGSYEYLVWLQKSDGTNDYADPGVRNRG